MNGRPDRAAFSLVMAGLVLLFIGLLLGYWISLAPSGKAMLPAHETAIGGGTFLIAVGLAWRSYVSRRVRLVPFGLITSNYILCSGLFSLNLPFCPPLLKPLSNLAIIAGCLEMTVSMLAAIIVFAGNRPARPSQIET